MLCDKCVRVVNYTAIWQQMTETYDRSIFIDFGVPFNKWKNQFLLSNIVFLKYQLEIMQLDFLWWEVWFLKKKSLENRDMFIYVEDDKILGYFDDIWIQ